MQALENFSLSLVFLLKERLLAILLNMVVVVKFCPAEVVSPAVVWVHSAHQCTFVFSFEI